jgi:hypothetical protein
VVSQPPTDRKILKKIHDRYLKEFGAFDQGALEPPRSSKVYVPIDCAAIASELKVDPDIVFGRLYYHLNKKYGYTQDDNSKVFLFSMQAGSDRHVVNFPLLSAVLAELHESWFRFTAPLLLSSAAFVISLWAATCGRA